VKLLDNGAWGSREASEDFRAGDGRARSSQPVRKGRESARCKTHAHWLPAGVMHAEAMHAEAAGGRVQLTAPSIANLLCTSDARRVHLRCVLLT
jgi:hypothetical protein